MSWALALLAAQVSAPPGIVLTDLSAGEFMRYCNGDAAEGSYCRGYVNAVTDVLVRTQVVCRPVGVTTSQLVAIVVEQIRTEPARWHIHPLWAIDTALRRAFPCRRR